MSHWLIKLLLALRGLTQSDLARLAGVSRQAVSLWFKSDQSNGQINCSLSVLKNLSAGLSVPISMLLEQDDIVSPRERKQLEAEYLWDRLYPSLEEFAIAIVRSEPSALARLVQIVGLFDAAKIAGKNVWKRFPRFKSRIHPKRAEQCEIVWSLQKNLGLI
ncbi:MAG: helix-turn-helix domain-containing protein [Deltaproteobacteria bacterium]|nr:helix-turn-helix domain-containing protein [Deltaproteobacteria bacterium]